MEVTEGEMGIWSPSPGATLSFLLFTYAPNTGWGAHLHDLTATGIWTEEKLKSPYRQFGD